MAIFGSSEESTEIKNVDTTGTVNNNIIMQEAKDTHDQLAVTEKLVFGTYILIALEAIKIGICLISAYRRHLKKQYKRDGDH